LFSGTPSDTSRRLHLALPQRVGLISTSLMDML
jgi:hypothetical protein